MLPFPWEPKKTAGMAYQLSLSGNLNMLELRVLHTLCRGL